MLLAIGEGEWTLPIPIVAGTSGCNPGKSQNLLRFGVDCIPENLPYRFRYGGEYFSQTGHLGG